jgi:two-component sensor histidine kinase
MADPVARSAIKDASAQVLRVAEVHRLVQSAAQSDALDLCQLLRELCSAVAQDTDTDLVFVGAQKVIIDASHGTHVALLVNELVSNALRHAASRVEVICRPEGQAVLLAVKDDRPGLPPGFDFAKQGNFGLSWPDILAASSTGT